ERETSGSGLGGAYGAAPEGTRVCDGVELVEESSAVPKRLAFVIDVLRLPGIDGVAPRGGMQQAVSRDGPSVCSRGAIEVDVVAVPLAAIAEFNDGEIPRNHHRNHAALAWFQREANRNRARKRFIGAGPLLVAVCQAAGLSEGFPNLASVSVRLEGGLITDFHSGRLDRGDCKLAVPFVPGSRDAVAVDNNSLHRGGVGEGSALEAIVVLIVEAASEIARKRAEPASHVGPREEDR